METVPSANGVVVSTYSSYEPLELSRPLYQLLGTLRAEEPLAAARARLQREQGAEIPDQLLVMLHQMRVLVAPGQPPHDPD
jgi:hypothetical protein